MSTQSEDKSTTSVTQIRSKSADSITSEVVLTLSIRQNSCSNTTRNGDVKTQTVTIVTSRTRYNGERSTHVSVLSTDVICGLTSSTRANNNISKGTSVTRCSNLDGNDVCRKSTTIFSTNCQWVTAVGRIRLIEAIGVTLSKSKSLLCITIDGIHFVWWRCTRVADNCYCVSSSRNVICGNTIILTILISRTTVGDSTNPTRNCKGSVSNTRRFSATRYKSKVYTSIYARSVSRTSISDRTSERLNINRQSSVTTSTTCECQGRSSSVCLTSTNYGDRRNTTSFLIKDCLKLSFSYGCATQQLNSRYKVITSTFISNCTGTNRETDCRSDSTTRTTGVSLCVSDSDTRSRRVATTSRVDAYTEDWSTEVGSQSSSSCLTSITLVDRR